MSRKKLYDYSEAIVNTRARSIRLELHLQGEHWDTAADIQMMQVKVEVALLRWIVAKRDATKTK